jgi:hypothetical protein
VESEKTSRKRWPLGQHLKNQQEFDQCTKEVRMDSNKGHDIVRDIKERL